MTNRFTRRRALQVGAAGTLGYLFTGVWTILICVMIFPAGGLNVVLAIVGIVGAVGILAGMLEPEPFGWKQAGAVNAISYIVWSLWLIVCGIVVIAG